MGLQVCRWARAIQSNWGDINWAVVYMWDRFVRRYFVGAINLEFMDTIVRIICMEMPLSTSIQDNLLHIITINPEVVVLTQEMYTRPLLCFYFNFGFLERLPSTRHFSGWWVGSGTRVEH